jgi:hypothetical protein
MADNYKNDFGVFAERPKVEKKIYNAKYIFTGLVIFFALVTLPFWKNLGKVVPPPVRSLDTPAIQKLAPKQCIMPTDWMRANHMLLLIDWREQVVRTGESGVRLGGRVFQSPDGRKFEASLSNTCMACHSNKTQFCDQCHNYVAVTPTCWGCHQDKEQKVAQTGQKVAQAEAK